MNSEPTIPNPQDIKSDSYVAKAETGEEKPKKRRHQFQPGQRPKDSRGRVYFVDQNHSVRRPDRKMTKAERKAVKRAKQRR